MTDERIVYLPETDSTNSEIRRRLVECPDMRGGTVVVADFQTAGRGQKGNSWESQSGKNLLFSGAGIGVRSRSGYAARAACRCHYYIVGDILPCLRHVCLACLYEGLVSQ